MNHLLGLASPILLTDHIYLFTTHITRTKVIVGIVVLVVAVVALAVFLMRRRRTNA